jgi:putative Holliday junction resolvase
MILRHISRSEDVARVASLAQQHEVDIIVIGQSLDDSGNPNFEGRRAMRFARSLQENTEAKVVLFDEAFTTQEARAARIEMNVSRKNRRGHLDSLAAAILLQSYLDSMKQNI